MNISRGRFAVVSALVLALVAYAAYRIGVAVATRQGIENLALVSLWSVRPSVQVIDYATTNPGAVPERIQVAADGAIVMVARQYAVFAPIVGRLPDYSADTLCAIAKNREIYRKRSPDLYDDALMSYLAKVHSEIQGAKVRCNA